MVTQALNQQIMIDPDLAAYNEANAALSGGIDHTFPAIDNSKATVARALEKASRDIGQSLDVDLLPQADAAEAISGMDVLTAHGMATALGIPGDCAKNAEYSIAWAAKLGSKLRPFPLANTLQSAGNSRGSCGFRWAQLISPVEAQLIAAYYWTLADKANFTPGYSASEEELRISWADADTRSVVLVRPRGNGLSDVFLIRGATG